MEPTNVCSHHLYAVDLEQEISTDRQPQKLPVRHIIARPMARKVPRAHAVAPANDERPLPDLFEKLMSGNSGEMSEVGMHFPVGELFLGGGVVGNIDVDSHLVDAFILLLLLFLGVLLLRAEATTVFKVYPLAEDYF